MKKRDIFERILCFIDDNSFFFCVFFSIIIALGGCSLAYLYIIRTFFR